MTAQESKLSRHLRQELKQQVYLPLVETHKDLSLQIAVLNKNQELKYSFGPSYKFFDLASLTKPIFTMSLCMFLEENFKGFTEEKVNHYLPWFKYPQVKIKDLLSHQSGAPALYPVFENLHHTTLEGLSPLNQLLRQVDFESMSEPTYSDVGYFFLGAVLEEKFNRPLWEIFKDFKEERVSGQGLSLVSAGSQMHFRITGDKTNIKVYAPTERCALRNKKIQGEVHDESCWAMGGVGTHAGLFGRLEDVIDWVKVLNLTFQKQKGFSKATIDRFYKKQKGDWRLGMMVPSFPRSSAGEFFSSASYGHLGFTGTSFWVDPKAELSVIVLSNRTYPDRRMNLLHQFRPHIHNLVYKTVKGIK